jgi:hypothetical protein
MDLGLILGLLAPTLVACGLLRLAGVALGYVLTLAASALLLASLLALGRLG